MCKSIGITLLLFLNSFVVDAQSVELLENTWYAEIMAPFVDDPPNSQIFICPENFNAIAQFSEDMLVITHPQCEVGFSAEIEYLEGDSFDLLSPFTIDENTCEISEFAEFIEVHFNFYFNDDIARNTFFYLIIERAGGSLELAIVNENASFDSIVYNNSANLSVEESLRNTIRISYTNNTESLAIFNLEEPAQFSVYNTLGQKQKEVSITHNNESLLLDSLDKGVYIAILKNDKGIQKTFNFLKY